MGSESLENTQVHGLTIRAKLLVGFGIILALFSIMLSLVLYNLYQTREYSHDVVSVYIPLESNSSDLSKVVDQLAKYYLSWLLTRDPAYKEKITASFSRLEVLERKIDDLGKDGFTGDELNRWNDFKAAMVKFGILKQEVESMVKQPNLSLEEIKKMWEQKIEPQDIAIENLLNVDDAGASQGRLGFIDMQSASLSAGVAHLVAKNAELEKYVIFMLIFTIVASVTIVIITSNTITRPLIQAINAAIKIANGERKINLVAQSTDETGVLITALAQMQQAIREGEDALAKKAAETKELLDNVVVTLAEVKQSVDIQSAGATEQAASINEITASLSEIEKSTTQTVDKARALGKAAKKTQEKGQLGLDSVEESVLGMKAVRDKVQIIAQNILELSKQTQQVGEITAVVTNLAQQSKMLALNASIEAAKAGESGRGFAVVAAEVKNLAEQSEQSTAQVQQILEDIRRGTEKAVMVTEEGTKEVDQGMKQVEQAGEIIRSLNDIIHDATVASQQIEAAISQEGVGIEQITAGMNEINQVTASLTQSVKQTTEVIDNLSSISARLKASVDSYKVAVD